jgi:integrase
MPSTREAARIRLAKYVVDGIDPVAEKRADRARMTFDTFISKHYEPWATRHDKTGAEQIARLRTCFAELLALPLEDVKAFHVQRWRTARLKIVTPATTNRDLNVLRGAFSRAVEWGLLSAHPLRTVKAAKTDRRPVVRYLSPDEETRLLDALVLVGPARLLRAAPVTPDRPALASDNV